jgi:hypothetical protein
LCNSFYSARDDRSAVNTKCRLYKFGVVILLLKYIKIKTGKLVEGKSSETLVNSSSRRIRDYTPLFDLAYLLFEIEIFFVVSNYSVLFSLVSDIR